MEVFNNKYLIISYLQPSELLQTYWTTDAYMDDEEYRTCLIKYLEIVQTYQPSCVLINAANSHYSIPPDTQEWVNQNIYPQAIEAGVKRLAYVVGEDFYLLLSLELIVDDTNQAIQESDFRQLFFKTTESATEWLLKK